MPLLQAQMVLHPRQCHRRGDPIRLERDGQPDSPQPCLKQAARLVSPQGLHQHQSSLLCEMQHHVLMPGQAASGSGAMWWLCRVN